MDLMADQICIETKEQQFAVMLEHHGLIQEMDVRSTLNEAENYALYLAHLLKLDVYVQGKKIN
jgi:hypothetical protein